MAKQISAVDEAQVSSEIGGDFIRMIRCRDKRSAWRLLAKTFQEAFAADQCAFLLVNVGNPEILKHAASYPAGVEALLDDTTLESLLNYLRSQERPVWSRSYEPVQPIESVELNVEARLFKSPLFTLWASINDRRGNVLGAIILARTGSEEHKPAPFSRQERHLARQLVPMAAESLDVMRTLKMLRDLRKEVHQAKSRDDILRATLNTAVGLLRVHSGGITTWSAPGKQDGALGPQLNRVDSIDRRRASSDCQAEELLENPSQRIVQAQRTGILPTFMSWGNEGEPIAKLEVDAPDGHVFNLDDLDLLDWVARHGASDCALVDKRLDLEKWQLEISKLVDPLAIADHLLERLKLIDHFEGGIVYRSVPRTNSLIGFAGFSLNQRNFRDLPYIFREGDHSAATFAFREHAFCCEDARDDPRVHPKGRSDFEIEGSLFAVPLGEIAGSDRFGSVVVWFKDKKLEESARNEVLARVTETVRYASSPLRIALFSQTVNSRNIFQAQVAIILQQMMRESDLTTNLGAIARGIEACGFTRVRMHELHYGDMLIGKLSRGMDHDRQKFYQGEEKYGYDIRENYYTNLVYEGVCRARQEANDAKIEDLLTRLYPSQDASGELIFDSSAERLGKPKGMPWANVPVISANKLYGLLTADKLSPVPDQLGRPKWDEITDIDLDALDVFAQLASRAYAMDEMRGMLVQRQIRILEDFVGVRESHDLVRRRLLLFLTHGEGGLGYSRAAMFAHVEDGSEDAYCFKHAVGANTKDEFESNAEIARNMPLTEVLQAADLEHDRTLNSMLQPLGATQGDVDSFFQSGATVRWCRATTETNSRIVDNLRRLGWRDFLLARMQAGDRDLGLIAVDRNWDPFGLIKSDVETLESFASRAGQILLRHEIVAERLSDVEHLANGVVHEFRSPLKSLRDASTVIKCPGDLTNLITASDELEQAVDSMAQTVTTFDNVFSNTLQHNDFEIRKIIETIPGIFQAQVPSCDVSLDMPCDTPDALVRVNTSAISTTLSNLIRNSLEAFADAHTLDPRIKIEVRRDDSHIRISVIDNGPGVTPSILTKLRLPIPKHTSKNFKEIGTGLLLAKWIAHTHRGIIDLDSISGGGFIATLVLPLS